MTHFNKKNQDQLKIIRKPLPNNCHSKLNLKNNLKRNQIIDFYLILEIQAFANIFILLSLSLILFTSQIIIISNKLNLIL